MLATNCKACPCTAPPGSGCLCTTLVLTPPALDATVHTPARDNELVSMSRKYRIRMNWRTPPKRRIKCVCRRCLNESADGEYSDAHLSEVRLQCVPTLGPTSLILLHSVPLSNHPSSPNLFLPSLPALATPCASLCSPAPRSVAGFTAATNERLLRTRRHRLCR